MTEQSSEVAQSRRYSNKLLETTFSKGQGILQQRDLKQRLQDENGKFDNEQEILQYSVNVYQEKLNKEQIKSQHEYERCNATIIPTVAMETQCNAVLNDNERGNELQSVTFDIKNSKLSLSKKSTISIGTSTDDLEEWIAKQFPSNNLSSDSEWNTLFSDDSNESPTVALTSLKSGNVQSYQKRQPCLTHDDDVSCLVSKLMVVFSTEIAQCTRVLCVKEK